MMSKTIITLAFGFSVGFCSAFLATIFYFWRSGLLRNAREHHEWKLTRQRKNITIVKNWRNNPGDGQ
jgi:hypothetical protein